MTEDLFPAMKKHLPAGVQAPFHTAYNVYDYGNLATLARGHDSVVEFHFDATGNNTASGGHVIVYSGFKPDKMDLALRDAIKNNVGIFSAYKHQGQAGISGRDNLQNVNIAANSGINYRLLELGFGTNKTGDRFRHPTNEGIKLFETLQDHISTNLEPQEVNYWYVDIANRIATDEDGNPTDEYPDWVQPIGYENVYKRGDIVKHNDKVWVLNADTSAHEPGTLHSGWIERE